MVYAPVAIWTLNRNEHLKRCIESLEKNSFARNTELFISVDYHPSERYEEGYQSIKNYLAGNKFKFKKVYMFYQETNLGPVENYNFIIREAFSKYDRIIISEDDNEFGPYFLEYMDYMLEKYESAEDVFAIGGYSYPVQWKNDGNSVVKINNIFSAWGSGIWREKYERCLTNLERKNVDILMKNFKEIFRIWRYSPKAFCNLVHSYLGKGGIMCGNNGDFLPEDITLGMYLIWKKQYFIIPKTTQVINTGYDGSGVHCISNVSARERKISKCESEILINMKSDVKFEKINCRKIKRMYAVSIRDAISNWKQYIFFRCYPNK